MGDFGKILNEWESGREGSVPSGQRRDDWFERELDRYPVIDKDAEAPSNESRHGTKAELLLAQDSIDLHGYTVAEAITATDRFIRSSISRGLKKVVVIHGKGRNGEGVLKREVRAYLERHPGTGAMGYSRGRDGGSGALWVVLRDRGK